VGTHALIIAGKKLGAPKEIFFYGKKLSYLFLPAQKIFLKKYFNN
jgi:hypothetical protein